MNAIADYRDLLSHSEATDEVHALAALLARIVTTATESSASLPPELAALLDEARERASVRRRLADPGATP